jgi:hypothetical protein
MDWNVKEKKSLLNDAHLTFQSDRIDPDRILREREREKGDYELKFT